MTLFQTLIAAHIVAGSIAIIACNGALCTKKGQTRHRIFGRYFFYAMQGIFVTAIPMSILIANPFLFCIALFSFYLAWSGWRFALRKKLPASSFDILISTLMLLVSISMVALAIWHWEGDSYQSIVLLVFGLLGGKFSASDLLLFKKSNYPPHERLTGHVRSMIGGTIAVFTAVLVVNVHLKPEWVVWLLPSVVFSPLIVYWVRRVKHNRL